MQNMQMENLRNEVEIYEINRRAKIRLRRVHGNKIEKKRTKIFAEIFFGLKTRWFFFGFTVS